MIGIILLITLLIGLLALVVVLIYSRQSEVELTDRSVDLGDVLPIQTIWKSHSTLTLLATQDLPTFLYYMIDPLKSWCWGAILFYPFKNSRFS